MLKSPRTIAAKVLSNRPATHIRYGVSRRIQVIAMMVGLGLAGGMAVAKEATAEMKVPAMDCAACTVVIKKALTQTKGVRTVDISTLKSGRLRSSTRILRSRNLRSRRRLRKQASKPNDPSSSGKQFSVPDCPAIVRQGHYASKVRCLTRGSPHLRMLPHAL